jgi:hypothetical protein
LNIRAGTFIEHRRLLGKAKVVRSFPGGPS